MCNVDISVISNRINYNFVKFEFLAKKVVYFIQYEIRGIHLQYIYVESSWLIAGS